MYDVSTTKVFVSYKTEMYRERFGFYTAGVRAAFKPMRTQTLMNLKNRIPEEKKRSVVYEVPCKDCSKTYTGETKRALKVILSKHKQAVSINLLHYIARTLKQ